MPEQGSPHPDSSLYFYTLDSLVAPEGEGGEEGKSWRDPLTGDQRFAIDICLGEDGDYVCDGTLKERSSGIALTVEELVLQVLKGKMSVEDFKRGTSGKFVIVGIDDGKFDKNQCRLRVMPDRRGKDRLTSENLDDSAALRGINNRFSEMLPGEVAFLSTSELDWDSGEGRQILEKANLSVTSEVWETRDPVSGKFYLAEYAARKGNENGKVPGKGGSSGKKGQVEQPALLNIVMPDGSEKIDPQSALESGVNVHGLVKQPGKCRYLVAVKGEAADQLTGRGWLNGQDLRFNRGAGELHFADCKYAIGKIVPYKDVTALSGGIFRWGCSGCNCRVRSAGNNKGRV